MAYNNRQSTLTTAVLSLLLCVPSLHAQIRMTDDGTPTLEDVLEAEQIASQCLGMNLVADGNQVSLSGNRLGVAFQPHVTEANLQRFFVVRYSRPDAGENWHLQSVDLHAVQTLDSGEGVHVTGLLDPDKAALLHQSVSELWSTILGPDFTITMINTSEMPEIHCDHARNQAEIEGSWHEVMVAAERLPDTPVLPPYLYATGIVAYGPDAALLRQGNYKFTFRDDASGYPEFVTVDCAIVPVNLCEENLDTLQAGLGISTDDEDTTQRDAAIMAVLPPAYTKEHIREIQASSGNGRESLVAQLADVPVSPARTVRGIVVCRRPLGSGDDWTCEYRFINYNQALANGMTVSVRTLDLGETQVETLVAPVVNDIINARNVSIAAVDGGYTLTASGFAMPPFSARFDAALNLVAKEYRER